MRHAPWQKSTGAGEQEFSGDSTANLGATELRQKFAVSEDSLYLESQWLIIMGCFKPIMVYFGA